MAALFPTVSRQWAALSPRERLLVSAGGAVLLIAALYVGLYQPLRDARAANVARQVRFERLLTALNQMPVTTAPVSDHRPIASLVTESAAAQGLAILRLDTPKPDLAALTLQDAAFDTLLLWIDGLNRDSGVTVASATLRRVDDMGTVSADLVLQAPPP